MSKSLVMTFINSGGKKASINLSNVKDAATKEEVTALMNTIITQNIFSSTGGDFKQIDSAKFVQKSSEEISVK